MYYIISFKLDLKLKFNNNNIIILNTILNQYSIAIYIFNIEQLVQHDFQLYYKYNYDYNCSSMCHLNEIMII